MTERGNESNIALTQNHGKKTDIMRTQFVTDDDGKKLAVILPIEEYKKMVDDLDELKDIKLFDAAKKGKQEFIDADQAFREIESERELSQK
jgi:hypothetical protein